MMNANLTQRLSCVGTGLLILLMLFTPVFSNANEAVGNDLPAEKTVEATISGTVTSAEDGAPLIGVTVLVKGTSSGTITDLDGAYTINANEGDILVFRYIGFEPREVTVGSQRVINVALTEDIAQLDEVVVVGYGTQKKSHLTGSVSKVTNEKLDQIPIARVDDALVGQISGVNIQMTNPAAGEAPTIRVRGQGSISFDASPLIVVDGIVVGNDADFLASLDMNDVASVEVLKDAASSAIYGSRGANGIIMITTKEGVEGPTQFDYNAYVGAKEVPGNDYLTTVDDWLAKARDYYGSEPLPDKLQYIERIGQQTDWQEVMMDGGIIQSHALSARGGTKNTKFRASMSYLDDQGVLLTDNFSKINFRLNLNTQVNDRVRMGFNLNPSYTKTRRFPIGLHDAIRQAPWLPLYIDEDNIRFLSRTTRGGQFADTQIGDYAWERMFDDFNLATDAPATGSGTDISTTSNTSALAKVLERERYKYQTKIYANAFLDIDLTNDLYFRQSIGGDMRFTRNTTWLGVQATRNGEADSESVRASSNQLHAVSESTLNFSKEVGRHDISAVAGFAYEHWDREYSDLEAAGYDNDFIKTIPAANLVGGSTFAAQEALVSYLSRVTYAFDSKYLLSVSARWDGSSKFGPDNKFGFFPAASLGWNVGREGFLADNDFIEDFKLRVSYGISGSNAGIGEYDHIGLLSPVGTGFGPTGFNADNIANTELQWEKLKEFNPGVDLSIMEGRFGLSFDYYERTSEDLLLNLPIPSVTGFGSALVNKGVVENKGVELELRSRNVVTRNFSWRTTALFTHNKNTLVDFAGANGLISIVDDKRAAEWIALEGQPIASFYGYVVKEEIAPEFIKSPFFPVNGQSQDIYVRDLNGDGVIDTDDRTILGSPYPDLIWSVNNTMNFGAFDFSFMFQGSHGAEVRNISSQYIKNEFNSNQDFVSDFPDRDLVVQRIFTSDDIQDASYFALRNLNLGYSIPANTIRGIGKLRMYVSAQNLLYIMADGYEGFNPEGVDLTNAAERNPLTFGYQRRPAPMYRTISAGLNVAF